MAIDIFYDGEIDIAVGKHRAETKWKNKQIKWSGLLAKLSHTHRTAEKYTEYLSAKKDRQDEIKDVGGFVGGYLTSGIRNKKSVLHKQLISLDVDFANKAFWDTFTLVYDNAAALYTTHKHSPENPRLRLIIPLSRPVHSDEYIAIARRIAGMLGIELFDITTYQPERLMYWPSTAKDGQYIFEHQDGEWLDADAVLDSYFNWKDSSEWPISDREDHVTNREIKKQGDPLDKPGLIGTFCRSYSISEVISKYLQEQYEECGMDNRYSFTGGSTAAGLIVYEDKYAFSHHGTDPASGKLCNAFDLVRLHLFGLNDEGVDKRVPINKLPSYLAMQDLAAKDGKVRKLIGIERLRSASQDFDGIEVPEDGNASEEDPEWLSKLDVDRKGRYYTTINNVVMILKNDPNLKGCFGYDKFMQCEMVMRNLPWRKIKNGPEHLSDKDDAGLRHYFERIYGIVSAPKIMDGLNLIFLDAGYHPIQDYVMKTVWDGTERLETLLVDYVGAEDTDYVRTVTRKAFVAAVARIFKPGIKFEYMLTLVGAQGKAKSTLFDIMGSKWFSDSFSTVQGKEAFEQLRGAWIIEVPELAGMRKAEVEQVKHFVAKRVDQYRPAYGRRVEKYPRQCVFFGTTNNRDFLIDPTGNRRFWPVDIYATIPQLSVFDDLTAEVVAQIWAEAYSLFKAGETLYLDAEMEGQAKVEQADHTEQDERAGAILRYLDTLLPEDWNALGLFERRQWLQTDELLEEGVFKRNRVCVAEIWCEALGGNMRDLTQATAKGLHNMLRNTPGWNLNSKKGKFQTYGVQRYYRRESSIPAEK